MILLFFLNGNLVKCVIYFYKDLKYLKFFVEIYYFVFVKGCCFYFIFGLSKILVIGIIEK